VGARGTPEDTPPTRFGTVRPRVQIPGPRLFRQKLPDMNPPTGPVGGPAGLGSI